jgi:hypothetical protein
VLRVRASLSHRLEDHAMQFRRRCR